MQLTEPSLPESLPEWMGRATWEGRKKVCHLHGPEGLCTARRLTSAVGAGRRGAECAVPGNLPVLAASAASLPAHISPCRVTKAPELLEKLQTHLLGFKEGT